MEFRIPDACEEPWETMERRPEGRFCDRCRHTVLDLSRMTRREAERRVARERGDSVCVQLAVGGDGDAIFRPEPRRASRWAGGLVLAAALTAGGCGAREVAEAIATEEPCPVEGPPMMPISLASAETPAQPVVEDAATPTEEQRELTRRKHEPQPQVTLRRGGMRRR